MHAESKISIQSVEQQTGYWEEDVLPNKQLRDNEDGCRQPRPSVWKTEAVLWIWSFWFPADSGQLPLIYLYWKVTSITWWKETDSICDIYTPILTFWLHWAAVTQQQCFKIGATENVGLLTQKVLKRRNWRLKTCVLVLIWKWWQPATRLHISFTLSV